MFRGITSLFSAVIWIVLVSCSSAEKPSKNAGEKSGTVTFNSPQYVPGTKFVFEKTNFGTPTAKVILEVRGNDATRIYNVTRGNKRWRFARRIGFPLNFGETWTYSYNVNRRGWCNSQTNRMKAEVSRSLEKIEINGAELDVVRITHKGRWYANCQATSLEGDVGGVYLYSPKLGMFVSTSFEIWSANGDRLQVNNGLNLLSFSVPGQKQK